MRVALLAQYFEPEPANRIRGIVAGLREAGHDVEVLTALPNWAKGDYYDGYERTAVLEERRQGVRVIRTYVWPYHGRSTLRRIANYASFALSASLFGIARLSRCDVLYVIHPPLTISLPAWLIATIRGVPFLYDVQDLWPEAGLAAEALRPGLFYRLLQKWEAWAYRRADHIVVLADDFARVIEGHGIARERISVLPNWADDQIAAPVSAVGVRARYGIDERAFVVMYAGNFGQTHGVGYVLHAAALLRDRHDIVFVFAGSGADYANAVHLSEELALPNAKFWGYFQPPAMPPILAAADVMIVHLKRSPAGAVSLPQRIVTYMACARPILIASRGAPRSVVEKAECGIACEPESAEAIAAAVLRLADAPREWLAQLGANGRRAYERELRKEVVVPQLVDVVERVAAG